MKKKKTIEVDVEVCDVCKITEEYYLTVCPICKRSMCDECGDTAYKFWKGWSCGSNVKVCADCWESDNEMAKLMKDIEDIRKRANDIYDTLRKKASIKFAKLVEFNNDEFGSYQWIKESSKRY